jgi:catecholate siderophore receptor
MLRHFLSLFTSAAAFVVVIGAAQAQQVAPVDADLPEVTVENSAAPQSGDASKLKPKPKPQTAAAPKPKAVAKPNPAAVNIEPVDAAASEGGQSQGGGSDSGRVGPSGVDGYLATRSSTATKTDTPLLDTPQAISVVPKELAKDQGSRDLRSALTYVPGIVVGQGEGHRDAPTIRGVSSTADFFIDGVRDDVQYFRDLYNVEVVEVLRGPNAMIFGRGGGGGVINRVTQKADGERLYEVTTTYGSIPSGSSSTPGRRYRRTWQSASTRCTRTPAAIVTSSIWSVTASTRR